MGKPRQNPVTDEEILAVYSREGVVKATARILKIGETTIFRVLMKNGIDTSMGLIAYRESAKRFDAATEQEIRARYESGILTADLVREFGGTIYSIKRAIQRAGGELRANPAPLEKAGEIAEIRRRYDSGESTGRISVAIGRSQAFVIRVMKRHGLSRRKSPACGDKHGSWRGGTWLRADGYRVVLLNSDDPFAAMRDRAGYVLEHRLVMARALGRPLSRQETVHHVNGKHDDNRLENLQLRQGRHGKGVVLTCADCGSHNIVSERLKET